MWAAISKRGICKVSPFDIDHLFDIDLTLHKTTIQDLVGSKEFKYDKMFTFKYYTFMIRKKIPCSLVKIYLLKFAVQPKCKCEIVPMSGVFLNVVYG